MVSIQKHSRLSPGGEGKRNPLSPSGGEGVLTQGLIIHSPALSLDADGVLGRVLHSFVTLFPTPLMRISVLVFTVSFGSWSNALGAEGGTSYRVQPGDVLLVSVWKEEGLERQVLVRPDGGLSFPLVGDLDARGKSVDELRSEIAARISRYIPDPVVTVEARQILGNQVYVLGKVNKPGAFVMTRELDVMQALSIAGGTTPFASPNDIRILRRQKGQQTDIRFRYGDVEKGKNLEQNILLKSGDIVVVP